MKKAMLGRRAATSVLGLVAAALSPTWANAQENRNAPAAESGVADIVVTATKRSVKLQDVPVAVSALSGEQLAASGINESLQLSQQTPGLTVNGTGGALAPFIRGVGSLVGGTAREGSVSVYLDGVVLPATSGNLFAFNNLERIEVLKGPQGTLFGRNATGGLIHLITPAPQSQTIVRGSLSYASYQTTEARFYASTGLADRLSADLSVYYSNQGKAYGRNITTGNKLPTLEEASIRTKWLFEATDTTKITAWFLLTNSDGQRGTGRAFLPGAVGVDGVTTYPGRFRDLTGGVDPDNSSRQRIGALQIDQEIGGLHLKSISAYQRFKLIEQFDNDATALPVVDVYAHEGSKIFTQEVQLLSNNDSKIKWILGAFYMNDVSGYPGALGLGLFGSAFGGGGVGIRNFIKTESYAAFGEATLPLGDATNLTVGARYTKDQRKLYGKTDILDDVTTRNVLLSIPIDPAQRASFKKPTYRAILDHKLTPDIMAYASYSRGFKSGNFNILDSVNGAFLPEVLDSFEGGLKTNLFDRHLRLNLSIFHYKYKDIQLGVFVGPTQVTTNATSADVTGGEVEGEFKLNEYFGMGFGAAYLHSKIGSFPNAICLYPQAVGDLQAPCDASGNTLPRSPKWTVNLAPRVTIPAFGGMIHAEASYYYNDGFFWDFSNIRKEKAYSLVNASVAWSAPDDRYEVKLFAKNLTNERYSEFTPAQALGDTYTANLPRMFGVQLSVNLLP